MINNVRISARKKRLELDSANIDIDPKHFDTSFIDEYNGTVDNYSEGKYVCIVLLLTYNQGCCLNESASDNNVSLFISSYIRVEWYLKKLKKSNLTLFYSMTKYGTKKTQVPVW